MSTWEPGSDSASAADWAARGVDVDTPSAARIYDYILGGKDNFSADRQAGDGLVAAYPAARRAIRTNRQFLVRAVEHLADRGVRRYLDVGSGLPTQDNVHQVAARHAAGSRVVYVDHDPIVLAHARALLSGEDTVIREHDLRDTARLLADPDVAALLDGSEPVALLLVAILHFVKDADEPGRLVRTIVDALPSGSYLVLSHATADTHEDASADAVEAYQGAGGPSILTRPKDEVLAFFDGLEFVEPGLVWAEDWHPAAATDAGRGEGFYAGVARKP